MPGIIVSTVIGSISGDIWQVLDSLSWLKIFAVALVFFVLTITPSISAQRKTLQEYLDTFKFDQDIFSAERLYKAVLKCQKRSKVRNLSFAVFEKYSDSYSWKWQRRIFEKSKAELSNELERQAGWYFWLNIIILLPIIFVIISILNYIVFPENIIEQWVGGRNIDSVLSILVQNIFFHAPMQPNFRELLFSDPLIKYSAIATLLLIGTNAISYVQDQNKILLGLRLKAKC